MSSIPPPHPVRRRPYVAAPLAVLAIGVTVIACQPPAAADATGPDCTLDVEVTWDGGTVAWITATTVPTGDVAPRFTFHAFDADGASIYYQQITGEASATVYPAVDAALVRVESGWRPGPLCIVERGPEGGEVVEVEPVEPPAYAPPAPPAGDHRTDTTPAEPAPVDPPVTRTLHSR